MADPADHLPDRPHENREPGADVNDTGNIEGKLQRQLELLKEADIPEADRTAIRTFFRFRRSEGVARNTLRTDLSAARNASVRATVPLTEMSETDIQDFMALLVTPESEGGYGLERDGGGMYNYKRVLRIFFRWMDGRDDYGAFPFHEKIEPPKLKPKKQAPEKRLTWDDVQAQKAAAAQGRNESRDRALIGVVAEGHRITAVAQLRVGDISPEGDDPTFRLNDDSVDGYKDMEQIERPLLYCVADVRRWVNQAHPDNAHPDGPRDHVPLWPIEEYDVDNPTKCALSNDGVEGVLERTAARAGIEKRINPHQYRHAIHTQLANDPKVDPRDQQHLGGWSDLRMIDHYDEGTAEEKNHNLRSGLGLASSPPDDESTTPEPRPCWNCSVDLTTEDFCPNCGEPQSVGTRLARRKAREKSRDGLKDDVENVEHTAARAELMDVIDSAEFWRRVESRRRSESD